MQELERKLAVFYLVLGHWCSKSGTYFSTHLTLWHRSCQLDFPNKPRGEHLWNTLLLPLPHSGGSNIKSQVRSFSCFGFLFFNELNRDGARYVLFPLEIEHIVLHPSSTRPGTQLLVPMTTSCPSPWSWAPSETGQLPGAKKGIWMTLCQPYNLTRYRHSTITWTPSSPIEPSIQFTIEEECQGTIVFLDTMVTRRDGSLSTTVFCKKIHTDRYLDFSSHQPLAHKVAVTWTLLTRADRIYTFQHDRYTEKEQVCQALESNSYPKTVICQHWRPLPNFVPPPSANTTKATITLPYVCHLAASARRILAPSWTSESASAPQDSQTIPGAAQTLHPSGDESRSSLSDSLWDMWLDRPAGHSTIGWKNKRALMSGNPAQSAVAEHAMDKMHVIDWEEAQVVDSHPHYTQWCTLEAWHISSERNNLKRDVGPLPSTYNPLIPSLTS